MFQLKGKMHIKMPIEKFKKIFNLKNEEINKLMQLDDDSVLVKKSINNSFSFTICSDVKLKGFSIITEEDGLKYEYKNLYLTCLVDKIEFLEVEFIATEREVCKKN